VLIALTTVGAAAMFTALAPRAHSAQVQLFVSSAADDNTGSLLQGGTFMQQRVKSYAQLPPTRKVLEPVIFSLKLPLTADQLRAQVSVDVPVDTVIIVVTVVDSSPGRAAQIADAIRTQLPVTIGGLEQVSAGRPSPVKVTSVRQTQVDPAPVGPRWSRNVPLASALGLLLGLGLALLRELLDTTINSEREVAEATRAPIIGHIAYDPETSEHPFLGTDRSPGRGEALRSLRTNPQFIDAANRRRSIVFTSSIAGEGKTTTAANLGLTPAAGGQRVCLVAADLRRPRLLDYLGREGSAGLTDLLVGRAQVNEVLQRLGSTTVWVVGSAHVPVGAIGAAPQFASLPTCLVPSVVSTSHDPSCGHLTPSEASTQRGEQVSAERQAVVRLGAGYLDTANVLCSPSSGCDAYVEGQLAYREDEHLSVGGSMLPEPVLLAALRDATGQN